MLGRAAGSRWRILSRRSRASLRVVGSAVAPGKCGREQAVPRVLWCASSSGGVATLGAGRWPRAHFALASSSFLVSHTPSSLCPLMWLVHLHKTHATSARR